MNKQLHPHLSRPSHSICDGHDEDANDEKHHKVVALGIWVSGSLEHFLSRCRCVLYPHRLIKLYLGIRDHYYILKKFRVSGEAT